MHRQVQPRICGRYDVPVYCVESIERVSWNLEIPKTPGAPTSRRVSTLATENEFLYLLALSHPTPAGVDEVEDAFQIDSRDDRQIQVYSSRAATHRYHFWKPSVIIPSDYNFNESPTFCTESDINEGEYLS